MTTPSYQLDQSRIARAQALVQPGLRFVEERFPLGAALIRYHWLGGRAKDVTDQLRLYQNPDGGFTRLEVDIKASVSNPFAARLAMQALLSLWEQPDQELLGRLGMWLSESQDEDGDWHFQPEVYGQELAPWFQSWEFPGLNPACCVAGLAIELKVLSKPARKRVENLFKELSSLEKARTGAFYEALPYVEYCERANIDDLEDWLNALLENVTEGADKYEDAGHFFDHALGSGPVFASGIPKELLTTNADRLLAEAQDDGGWPTPYDPAWRPWVTTTALMTLARLRDGV